MMSKHNLQPDPERWPSYVWVVVLQLGFYGWLIVVLGWLALTVLNWLSIIELPAAFNLLTNLGWGIILIYIALYWWHRLKGKSVIYQALPAFMDTLDWSGRQIVWRTIARAHTTESRSIAMSHLLQVLGGLRPVLLALVRLNFNAEDWQLVVSTAIELADPVRTQALAYAKEDRNQISWDHLFKAIINASPGFQQVLAAKKITLDEALAAVDWTRRQWNYRPVVLRYGLLHDLFTPQRNLNKTWTAKPTPVLDRFGRNLTELAKVGLLTSAKVRAKEVEEAIQVLSKSQSNSLILVGEPGVGKTSVVGDIALRMLRGDIPSLNDYKLIELDVSAMIGATGGSFQELFSRAVQEASGSGNSLLFIGNLDQLGKAKSGEGFDLSAILLDALQNNNLQLIGTADPLNYKRYIENNANLVALFTRVNVEELAAPAAALVLEDLSRQIESRQRVTITLSAVKQAVALSQQYIHEGKLPDKAEDLLDEAAVYASRRRMQIVTDKEVETVMSSKTNIPIGEISWNEKAKLTNLETMIHQRLIGQNEAVTAVVEALKRARLGVAAIGKRPIGSFLFLGPTGVGKTELAKSLAWAYFGDETKMVRLDMGEYQTRESVHNLLGAPVVMGEIALAGGAFTEAVKKMPFAVVLLDEIEKAHNEVLNVFLRVLDEGKMTDNLGNTIDFTHAIIIATSNAEARFIEEAVRDQMPYAKMQKQLTQFLTQQVFKPEFVNRFDGVIVFKPLTMTEIEQIADIKIRQLSERLKTDKGIELQVSPAALKALAAKGYDPAFGARPLERVIREVVETKVANSLLSNSEVKRVIIDEADALG